MLLLQLLKHTLNTYNCTLVHANCILHAQAGSAALQAVSASEQQLVEYKQRAQAALKKSSALASEFAAKNRALHDEAAELRLQSQADSDTAEVSTL
jgi:hypothetical protein